MNAKLDAIRRVDEDLDQPSAEKMLTSVPDTPTYLIVDDSPLGLRWLDRILRDIVPCEVIEAGDGAAAVDRLASIAGRVDAIISDLRMPNMNGLELLKQVRLGRTSATQNVPFLIVTDYAERAFAGLALSLDVDAFLARPIKQRALRRHLVRTGIERHVMKSVTETEAVYGSVDVARVLSLQTGLDARREAPVVAEEPGAATNGFPERLVPLADIPEDTPLARDAVNGTGLVLLKAGEIITRGLKAVLLSYAEIDESLTNVWVSPRHIADAK